MMNIYEESTMADCLLDLSNNSIQYGKSMCPSLRAYAKMPEIYETGGV
jgi:hypothetical protein